MCDYSRNDRPGALVVYALAKESLELASERRITIAAFKAPKGAC